MSPFLALGLLIPIGLLCLILWIVGLASKKSNLTRISGLLLLACILGGIWAGIEAVKKTVEVGKEFVNVVSTAIDSSLMAEVNIKHVASQVMLEVNDVIDTAEVHVVQGRAFLQTFPFGTCSFVELETTRATIDSLTTELEAVSFDDVKSALTPSAEWREKLPDWDVERLESLEHYQTIQEDADARTTVVLAIDTATNTVYFYTEAVAKSN